MEVCKSFSKFYPRGYFFCYTGFLIRNKKYVYQDFYKIIPPFPSPFKKRGWKFLLGQESLHGTFYSFYLQVPKSSIKNLEVGPS